MLRARLVLLVLQVRQARRELRARLVLRVLLVQRVLRVRRVPQVQPLRVRQE